MTNSSNESKKSKKDRVYNSPSLVEPQSTGGAIAKSGFRFQDGALLAKIPQLLEIEGFESIIQESAGDFEIRYFSPSEGRSIETYEAKNHHVTPAKFWAEIDRFIKLSESESFSRFVIVCTSLSDEIRATANELDRIRLGSAFQEADSTIVSNSTKDFKEGLKSRGGKEHYADFLIKYVFIENDWTNHEASAKGIFRENAARSSILRDLPNHAIGACFNGLLELLSRRIGEIISRKELEDLISTTSGQSELFEGQKISLEALTTDEFDDRNALHLAWSHFFGDEEREFPPTIEWQDRLVHQLKETQRWIKQHRSQRRIILTGSSRLSSAIAIGHAFAAVKGFAIDVNSRGVIWSTDSHPTSADNYQIEVTHTGEIGTELIAIIQNVRSIGESLRVEPSSSNFEGLPSIRFNGVEPLRSAREANIFVAVVKRGIQQRLEESGASKIHLFTLCSLPFAVFLGHRLNGLAPVQCYEWIGGTSYVPTVFLPS